MSPTGCMMCSLVLVYVLMSYKQLCIFELKTFQIEYKGVAYDQLEVCAMNELQVVEVYITVKVYLSVVIHFV